MAYQKKKPINVCKFKQSSIPAESNLNRLHKVLLVSCLVLIWAMTVFAKYQHQRIYHHVLSPRVMQVGYFTT